MFRWCMVSGIWYATDGCMDRWTKKVTYRENIKNEISKMKKNSGDIIILHKCTKNHDHLLYCSRDMTHDRCNGYFHFGLFFALLPLYHSKKSEFQKNEKSSWRYHHFTHVYQRWWLDDVWFLGYGMQQTDAWTDGQKKWHIEVGAPPKKINISNRVKLSLGWKKRES